MTHLHVHVYFFDVIVSFYTGGIQKLTIIPKKITYLDTTNDIFEHKTC